ncbi:MAG: serine/threonine protein kinase [Bdellovibrionales bacterium]|nr:serine/threonine protein kinase [Bdellovibrionales bacterium]
MDLKLSKFGKFILLKQVARGGMAEIFLGCSGKIESAYKFVVIKRILLAHSHNKEFNKMFQNEGKIAVNLNHSNVCSIYEFGIEKDQYFICMEYIAGRNLRQLTKKLKSQKRNLDVAICAYIIKHVCNGLDYAHNCTDSTTGQPLNIIHRDISPQNVMVSFEGNIKVIDFGIAKIDDSEATRAGVLKGKFEYMSPEQVSGKKLDKQTDIFSLGCVLWELLAGKKLFTGSNEMQLLKKIRDCRIPDLRKRNSQVPDKLVEIVNKALMANKNLRYKTAAEMGSDLSVFLNKFYPEFTEGHFNSFIKEVYVEEILEERQNLKKYLRALGSKTQSFKTAQHLSSALFDEDDTVTGKSSFVGYQTTQNRVRSRSVSNYTNEQQSTQTQSQNYTATETQADTSSKTTPSQEITKTAFDDDVLGSKVSGRPILESDGYSNVIKTPKKSDDTGPSSSTKYQPWKDTLLDKNRTVPFSGRDKYRRNFASKKTLVSLCVLSIIGLTYFFIPKNVKLFVQKNVNVIFKNREPDLPMKTPGVSEREPTSDETAPLVRKVKPQKKVSSNTSVLGKSVFLVTQPSGAQIYINSKRVEFLTPTTITVPRNKKFRLTLKRKGYEDKTVTLYSPSLKNVVSFPMQKRKKERRKNETIIINE